MLPSGSWKGVRPDTHREADSKPGRASVSESPNFSATPQELGLARTLALPQESQVDRPPVIRRALENQAACAFIGSPPPILKGFDNPAQGRPVLGQWGDGPTLGNRVRSSPTLKAVAPYRPQAPSSRP